MNDGIWGYVEEKAGQLSDLADVARAVKPDLGREEAANPADYLTAEYDCPTGTCDKGKPCAEVTAEDEIDPFSTTHTKRNECNRCPKTNPVPETTSWFGYKSVKGYYDSEANQWEPDSAYTAPHYHGDPGLMRRNPENMTYRLESSPSGGRGWQCRYYKGTLDDVSTFMGTYDFAEGGTALHMKQDVAPHDANPNYVKNLTATF